jgi:hypothetical protein
LVFLKEFEPILKIIAKFELIKAHIVTTPTNLNVHLSVSHENDDEQEEFFPCQEVVGSFMFMMINTVLTLFTQSTWWPNFPKNLSESIAL